MKPNHNNLILIPDNTKINSTASGIIFSSADKATLRGTIQQLGESVNRDMKNCNKLNAGDVVHYYPEGATEIKCDGKPVVLIHRKYISHVE